ncbi:hypothetical protein [Paenibacillus qinlingensis]|uniref:hypothetical protein n=1 Tax=Paenibacillus qinlingensis TaxID=1837343 RepID=UPI0015664DD0|nr:hypothetical protein [Paenibacillus qinlingensis]NQX62154.1 hypothetical protein [Paenibacillus qinlingensis]
MEHTHGQRSNNTQVQSSIPTKSSEEKNTSVESSSTLKYKDIQYLQRTIGNRAVASLFNTPKTNMGETIQRKIQYTDKEGKSELGVQESAWCNAYKQKMGKKFTTSPFYFQFSQSDKFTINVNTKNREVDYFKELAALLATDPSTLQSAKDCNTIAPNVLITYTETITDSTKSTDERENQTIIFNDKDITPRESAITGDKAKTVNKLVSDSKKQIGLVLNILDQLCQTVEDTKETSKFKDTLTSLLSIQDKDSSLPAALEQLRTIFLIMQKRLSAAVLEVSTMSLNDRLSRPNAAGLSSPKRGGDWILKNEKHEATHKTWEEWLKKKQDFEGDIQLRIGADQILYKESYNKLLTAFIHELSHASASTQDYAYVHEFEKYKNLDYIKRLGNADTIALIVEELIKEKEKQEKEAQPVETSGKEDNKKEDNYKEEQDKSTQEDIPTKEQMKKWIVQLAEKDGVDDVFKVKVSNYLAQYGKEIAYIEDEFEGWETDLEKEIAWKLM